MSSIIDMSKQAPKKNRQVWRVTIPIPAKLAFKVVIDNPSLTNKEIVEKYVNDNRYIYGDMIQSFIEHMESESYEIRRRETYYQEVSHDPSIVDSINSFELTESPLTHDWSSSGQSIEAHLIEKEAENLTESEMLMETYQEVLELSEMFWDTDWKNNSIEKAAFLVTGEISMKRFIEMLNKDHTIDDKKRFYVLSKITSHLDSPDLKGT